MFDPWEPTDTEIELLMQNPKRRCITANSTIGKIFLLSTLIDAREYIEC